MLKSTRIRLQLTLDGACTRCGVWKPGVTAINTARRDGLIIGAERIAIGIALAHLRASMQCAACKLVASRRAKLVAVTGGAA